MRPRSEEKKAAEGSGRERAPADSGRGESPPRTMRAVHARMTADGGPGGGGKKEVEGCRFGAREAGDQSFIDSGRGGRI